MIALCIITILSLDSVPSPVPFLLILLLNTPSHMVRPSPWAAAAALTLGASCVSAVTVYGTTSTSADGSAPTQCIGAIACDGRVLTPTGTQENFNSSIPVQLYPDGMDGLSIGIPGYFGGFSIELSVADKIRMSFTISITLFISLIHSPSGQGWGSYKPHFSQFDVHLNFSRWGSVHSNWRKHAR